MKNFISPVYIKPNSSSEERICVGVFAGGERNFFSWSERKLKYIEKFSDEKVLDVLRKSFKNLEEEINELKTSPKKLFETEKYAHGYFSYLNRYNKGLVEFSAPKTISKPLNEKEFMELFAHYTGEKIGFEKAVTAETFENKIERYLSKEVFTTKADKNYRVTNEVIKTIYRPHNLNFISCNGGILAGHSIDFTSTPGSIENKLYEFRVLVEGLIMFSKEKELGKGEYFVYHNIPEDKDQKKVFDNARKDSTKGFELKETEEIESAAKKLEKNYRKFTEVISE